jgi:hypothetical protein
MTYSQSDVGTTSSYGEVHDGGLRAQVAGIDRRVVMDDR